tara:strand:- start:60 stop:437 length:378 start_codon:yes stop_codon:yes gene_type:complete
MVEKRYKNIKDVAAELDIKEHTIRYWDSVDPKTNKIRFQGLSTRKNHKGIRFFNKENIKKLNQLRNLLYENGKHNYSLKLANKIISKKSKNLLNNVRSSNDDYKANIKKLSKIASNLRLLLVEKE